jgi:hypothetical protein
MRPARTLHVRRVPAPVAASTAGIATLARGTEICIVQAPRPAGVRGEDVFVVVCLVPVLHELDKVDEAVSSVHGDDHNATLFGAATFLGGIAR